MGQAQSATVVSPCHPRWCGQRLTEPPAHCLTGSRRSGSITMLMWPGVSLPCAARWLRGNYHASMPRTSPVGEWDHWPIDALSWDRHSQQLHSTHLPTASGDHWCNTLAIMPRTSPVGERDMSRSRLSVPWDRHSQRQYFLRATLDGVDRGLLNCLRTVCLAADGRVR